MYSTAAKWEKGDTVIKNHKIRIYPDQQQKKILLEWFGTCRFVYNRAVEYSKNPNSSENLDILFNKSHCFNFITMRNIFVTEKGSENSLNKWEFNTPKDIRAGAVAEMTTRLSQNVSALKSGRIQRFNMHFKSKRDSASISIAKPSIKFEGGKVSIYSRYLKPLKLGKRYGKKCKYSSVIECDSRMIFDGRYFYILIPKKIKVKEKENKNKIVALDPGKRVFQTGFSDTEFFESHINEQKYEELRDKIRLLQSLWDKKEIQKNPRKKIFVLFKKIKNLVSKCHWKTASYLVKNYNDVLLPSFESQEMVKRSSILNKKTKHDLLMLSHYAFKVKLKEKALEFKNFRIHDVNESYTSKTCSCCGSINNVGSKKYFECQDCHIKHNRDVNAARNIFIKYVSS